MTASLAGVVTFPTGGAYAASKHAVVAVAEQAAMALHGTPVKVTVICPALVRTGMSPVGADPDDVAESALRAIADGAFAQIPADWQAALRDRASRLARGAPPKTHPNLGDARWLGHRPADRRTHPHATLAGRVDQDRRSPSDGPCRLGVAVPPDGHPKSFPCGLRVRVERAPERA